VLTEEGYKARFWGPFSALRRVLEGKKVPDNYYGPTSVSDNIFEAISRHLELAIVVREHEADLINAATVDADLGRALLSDLEGVRGMLHAASGHFADESDRIERLLHDVYRAVSMPGGRGDTKGGA
jgi:hypothetical protein